MITPRIVSESKTDKKKARQIMEKLTPRVTLNFGRMTRPTRYKYKVYSDSAPRYKVTVLYGEQGFEEELVEFFDLENLVTLFYPYYRKKDYTVEVR